MDKTCKVTLIGTGLMGFPMSQNLLKAGWQLTVWNRSLNKAEPLGKGGAIVAASAADAIRDADVVITMLSDGKTTAKVIGTDENQSALKPGALWIDMSSIKPEEARQQRGILNELSVDYLDAPVSGGTKGAEAGSLAIMVGGDADIFDKGVPVLQAMGRPVHVGPTGSGQLAKLANQAIVAITIGAVAEAMLLLEKGGADPAAVRTALKGGFADSTILQQHGTRMTERNFVPGGLSKFQLKDLDNVLAEAEGLNLSLPSTQSVRDRFEDFVTNMDGADQDHSGLFLELLQRNNLTP